MTDPNVPVAQRLSRDAYYMELAFAVRKRANCLGRRVGAVLVLDDRVIATGYNGTPANMKNCDEGGCDRCAHPDRYMSGTGYDLCICVHAEQNALLTAARFGIAVAGATLYSTVRPCFGCTKELLQAEIARVYFHTDWKHPDDSVQHEYERIQSRIRDGIRQLAIHDPDAEWARGRGAIPAETGHPIPGNEGGPHPTDRTDPDGATTQETDAKTRPR